MRLRHFLWFVAGFLALYGAIIALVMANYLPLGSG